MFLTLFLGLVILSDKRATEADVNYLLSAWADHSSEIWAQFATFSAFLLRKSRFFLQLAQENRDLVFYGGTGLMGSLMVILMIWSSQKVPEQASEVESLLKDLKREKEHAENLARLKSEFLNQVSHELRTPLAVIMGYVECILDGLYGQLDEKNKNILNIVSKQSTDLKDMIERILVFSRLEADKSHVRIEEFSLGAVLDDLKGTYAFLGRQKGLELKWEIPEQMPMLTTDRERLKEILNNLLQNALKYTDQGSVTLRTRYLSTIDCIALEVTDTGIGIPRDSLPTIFDPFFQVHKTSTENSRGGIGLGLSIVKKHIEQLRGTIDLESNAEVGTSFKISLPRVYQEKPDRSKISRRLLHFFRGTRNIPEGVSHGITAAEGRAQAVQTG